MDADHRALLAAMNSAPVVPSQPMPPWLPAAYPSIYPVAGVYFYLPYSASPSAMMYWKFYGAYMGGRRN